MKRKIGIIVGVIVAVLVMGIAVAAILFSVNVGKEVAEGLLYQNQGNDTKSNSINQLELWGYDLKQFENQYTPGEKLQIYRGYKRSFEEYLELIRKTL